MHGEAAGRALEAAGATVRLDSRVESLDELDADAIVVAAAAAESGAAARRARARRSRTRRSSASTCSSTGRCCATPLAALLDSPAHWVFDRGALTGHQPPDGAST